MNYLLLVKYVPDVSMITDCSFDAETGNLRRSTLPGVTNPCDVSAIGLLGKLIRISGDAENKTIALTMGPHTAEASLREALACVADRAWHMSDRRFAGSDTWATADYLSRVVKMIAEEEFGGEPFIIFCGMQSNDGDTAQVPAQLAAALNMPIVDCAFNCEVKNGAAVFSCIADAGSSEVRVEEPSYMVTVSSFEYPAYPEFGRSRWALNEPVKVVDAEAAGIETDGPHNSKTRVVRVFAPEQNTRLRSHITDIDAFAAILLANARKAVHAQSKPFAEYSPSCEKEVWVVAEPGEALQDCTAELLCEARFLAKELGGVCCMVSVSALSGEVETEAASFGADKIYCLADAFNPDYRAAVSAHLARLVEDRKPDIVLFSATQFGRLIAPMTAFVTGNGLTADCTSLRLQKTDDSYELIQTRPALGGNIMAEIRTRNSRTTMTTVRPGVFQAARGGKRQAQVKIINCVAKNMPKIHTKISRAAAGYSLAGDVVFSGGRGLGSKEVFENDLMPLAPLVSRLNSCKAVVGASRAAVDAGFAPRKMQVGQTGKTVSPNLYFCAGISGAVQHTVGIEKSCVIMSVNSDPTAAIFAHSDYYYVGDSALVLRKIRQILEGKL
ncbi:MAG: FAD-binding protein [Phycisphaerae bacterium]|jgi:electron transfer flavoprotein alpha subunit